MKIRTIQFLAGIFSVVLLLGGCQQDDRDLTFLDGLLAPTNLALQVQLAQDNSGTATLTPSGDGATLFTIDFGDNSDLVEVQPGSSAVHVYAEGTYTAVMVARNLNGETAEFSQAVVVSFLPPENLVITVNPVAGDPFSREVSATADLAVGFEVYFGDVADEDPTPLMVGETIAHTYPDVGSYELRVVALSGGAETIEATETIVIENPIVLPIDFESTTIDYAFIDFGGATNQVIDNPDPSGINTSSKVAEFFKEDGAEIFAGTVLELGGPIDFSSQQAFKISSWSPQAGITVRLKIENATDSTIFAELDATTTVENAWEVLTFDFSSADLTQEYSKIVVFFDFGNPGTGTTYYYDDIAQITIATEDFELFEDFEGTPPTFVDFGNIDPTVVVANPAPDGTNGTSNVARFSKAPGAEVWGGTFFELTDAHIEFSDVAKMRFKSWSPTAGTPVLLKLENQDASLTTEIQVNTTVANAWEELVFEFDNPPSAEYVRVVVFYNFGNPGDGTVYYFDEMEVIDGALISSAPALPIEDFEGAPPTLISFGNIDPPQIVANPNNSGINPSSMSVSQVKNVGSEVWAGTFFEVTDPLDLNSYTSIRVLTHAPQAGIPILLKIENADASVTHEIEITNSVANDWEELVYDFSGAPAADYIRIVIFFDFGTAGDGSTYYFDEVQLVN